MNIIDLKTTPVRELNAALHHLEVTDPGLPWRVRGVRGAHAIACGLHVPVTVEIEGHAGYYCAGMNQLATVHIYGNDGVGVAENMMSGYVHVDDSASQSAGATARGGLLVIDGDASARCGVSMKGVDIVVKGSVRHMSAFMEQAGNLVVCGDAGEALGDSIYEARIFVRGKVADLGPDYIEKPMREDHLRSKCPLTRAAAACCSGRKSATASLKCALPQGHRPAPRLPVPRLDRSRRPHHQDRGTARDHGLGEADLRKNRRVAHLLRRGARGESRCRRGSARRNARGTGATQEVFIEHGGIPRSPRYAKRWRRCRNSACIARCSSSSPAASAPAPVWPRRSPWARTPFPSAQPR